MKTLNNSCRFSNFSIIYTYNIYSILSFIGSYAESN